MYDISHEWLEQCRRNLQSIFTSTIDDLIRFCRSKVKVTAGSGKNIHVDVVELHIFSLPPSHVGGSYGLFAVFVVCLFVKSITQNFVGAFS